MFWYALTDNYFKISLLTIPMRFVCVQGSSHFTSLQALIIMNRSFRQQEGGGAFSVARLMGLSLERGLTKQDIMVLEENQQSVPSPHCWLEIKCIKNPEMAKV